MRFTGLMRVRNAGDLIGDSLDHLSTVCDEVFVFDDASEDDTVAVARRHAIVRDVFGFSVWDPNQQWIQSVQRHVLFEYAKEKAKNPWFLYLDADERIVLDPALVRAIPRGTLGFTFRLFDFYLTPDDSAPYRRGQALVESRTWCGPEYRDILMAFHRDAATFPVSGECVREPALDGPRARIGSCRHYGKAISVEDWERKCSHYANHVPRYAAKWASRRGRAIHTKSDFGAPLVEWKDRNERAVPVPV